MNVKITLNINLKDDEFRIQSNHEVDHTAWEKLLVDLLNNDPNDPVAWGMLLCFTVEEAEMSAYTASALTAQRMGKPQYTLEAEGRNFTIWGGGEVDREVLRQYLRTAPNYKNVLNELFFK